MIGPQYVYLCFRIELYPKAIPLELYAKTGRIQILVWSYKGTHGGLSED